MRVKKPSRPRKPSGRWVYYLLYQDIIWPCPVRWEWESGFGGWIPFYYSPTFEFIAADPSRVTRIHSSGRSVSHSKIRQGIQYAGLLAEEQENDE